MRCSLLRCFPVKANFDTSLKSSRFSLREKMHQLLERKKGYITYIYLIEPNISERFMVCTLKCFVSRFSPTCKETLLHPNFPSKADVCQKEERNTKIFFPMVIPRCELPRMMEGSPFVKFQDNKSYSEFSWHMLLCSFSKRSLNLGIGDKISSFLSLPPFLC